MSFCESTRCRSEAAADKIISSLPHFIYTAVSPADSLYHEIETERHEELINFAKVNVNVQSFTESSRFLKNPNRGFYHIYRFYITDDFVDYPTQVDELYSQDMNTTLALVEINLQKYREGPVSEAGMKNIKALFQALSDGGKQLIVRFLYDWEGKSSIAEPEKIDVILGHMRQMGPILQKYERDIFTLQGLFVGDWGEMHDARYGSDEDLQLLAQTLALAAGPDSLLSVRTPAQWRTITLRGKKTQLASRIGLFNDGILSSESDLGTYDMVYQRKERRTRKQELIFQNELCAHVPNGGEVVIDNPYNDFENAARDLASMHVTYLNKDYDAQVFSKWADTVVSDKGCFTGMDGLSYMERHLGYRLLISGVKAVRRPFQRYISVKADFRNAGFAPLYTPPDLLFTLRNEEGESVRLFPAEHHLEELTGGSDAVSTVRANIPLDGLKKGVYRLYLSLTDPDSGDPILLANTQDSGPDGYFLGDMEILS